MTFENDKERAEWIGIVREGMFKLEPYEVRTRQITGGYGTRAVTALEQAIGRADAFISELRQREKESTNDQ
jgi:hypothetical protein